MYRGDCKYLCIFLLQQQMELQRGKVRVEKYAASRQKHSEEIGLGLSLGPHSESLR